MKKTSKRGATKAAKKVAKPKQPALPKFKDAKAVAKAVIAGNKPSGLKLEINNGTKIATLSWGGKAHRSAFPYDADAMLAEFAAALGIKVVKSTQMPTGI